MGKLRIHSTIITTTMVERMRWLINSPIIIATVERMIWLIHSPIITATVERMRWLIQSPVMVAIMMATASTIGSTVTTVTGTVATAGTIGSTVTTVTGTRWLMHSPIITATVESMRWLI